LLLLTFWSAAIVWFPVSVAPLIESDAPEIIETSKQDPTGGPTSSRTDFMYFARPFMPVDVRITGSLFYCCKHLWLGWF